MLNRNRNDQQKLLLITPSYSKQIIKQNKECIKSVGVYQFFKIWSHTRKRVKTLGPEAKLESKHTDSAHFCHRI